MIVQSSDREQAASASFEDSPADASMAGSDRPQTVDEGAALETGCYRDESTVAESSLRILVVEDDHHIGRLVERILVREGFEVVRVMDVESAWNVLDQPRNVDLLFTDVVLPGSSSGAELAATLRARRPELPIILTTGYDQSRIAGHPGLLESVAFLPKPFTAAQVRDLVRVELGRN
ncbi:MAG: response regulator [Gammaproteobacteria bacterium]|nr:MAG: response regulator [Gammaproteobacteria bacterium]